MKRSTRGVIETLAGMVNLLRAQFLSLLLTALIGWLSLGCGASENLRRNAEIARKEADYLETNAVVRWAIENGRIDWDIPTFKDINTYIPEAHPVRQRGGKDPFGNPYILEAVGDGVAVDPRTIHLCAEVTKRDTAFWGHHDERVLGLIQAAKRGDIAAVRTLVKSVPDPNIPNKFGDKALVWAMANGNDEMERILTSHGAVLEPGDGTPLWLAIGKQNVKVVKSLLVRFPYMATVTQTAAGWNGIPETWQKAIYDASSVGNTEIVQLLLECGADPNTGDGDVLSSAVTGGHLGTVRLLVEAGAQITPKALESATGEVRLYLESRLNATTNGAPSSGVKSGAGQ